MGKSGDLYEQMKKEIGEAIMPIIEELSKWAEQIMEELLKESE